LLHYQSMRSSSLHNSLLTVQTLRFKDFGSEADALTLPYGATEGEGTISLPTAFSNNLDLGSFIRKALAPLHSLPLPNSLPLFHSSTLPLFHSSTLPLFLTNSNHLIKLIVTKEQQEDHPFTMPPALAVSKTVDLDSLEKSIEANGTEIAYLKVGAVSSSTAHTLLTLLRATIAVPLKSSRNCMSISRSFSKSSMPPSLNTRARSSTI
jgi:hypothetical protein